MFHFFDETLHGTMGFDSVLLKSSTLQSRNRNWISLQSAMRSIDQIKPAADWEEFLSSLFARCSDPKIPKLVPEEHFSSSVMSVMECLSRNCGALLETKTDHLLP